MRPVVATMANSAPACPSLRAVAMPMPPGAPAPVTNTLRRCVMPNSPHPVARTIGKARPNGQNMPRSIQGGMGLVTACPLRASCPKSGTIRPSERKLR